MAASDSDKQVFDVSKPGTTAPHATGKPVILTHKPVLKDSVVNSDQEDALIATTDKSDPVAPQHGKNIDPPEGSDLKEDKEKSDNSETASSDEAEVDAVVSQTKGKNDNKQTEEDEKRAKEVEKLIEDKKYFVKIRAAKRKRNKRAFVVFLLVIIFGIVGAGLAADAELINPGFTLPFDLIKTPKPVESSVIIAPVAEKKDTQKSTEKIVEIANTGTVPTGWKQYSNNTYKFSLAYPADWSPDEQVFSEGASADKSIFLVVALGTSIKDVGYGVKILNTTLDEAIAARKKDTLPIEEQKDKTQTFAQEKIKKGQYSGIKLTETVTSKTDTSSKTSRTAYLLTVDKYVYVFESVYEINSTAPSAVTESTKVFDTWVIQ